jgi:hypothetical protein
MAERKSIRIADLLIDEMNPRITTPNAGQRDALRSIAEQQGSKLYTLAQDIVDSGLSPIDVSLVMPKAGDRNRHIVLEGNRRLAALRALESPDLLDGALPPAVLKKLRTLSREYLKDPLDEMECVIVPDREASQHWIELRHTGQNDGAGTVPWGADETSRYRVHFRRGRGNAPHDELPPAHRDARRARETRHRHQEQGRAAARRLALRCQGPHLGRERHQPQRHERRRHLHRRAARAVREKDPRERRREDPALREVRAAQRGGFAAQGETQGAHPTGRHADRRGPAFARSRASFAASTSRRTRTP